MERKDGQRRTWGERHRVNCKDCGIECSSENTAVYLKNGRSYFHTYCKKCNQVRTEKWGRENPQIKKHSLWKHNLKRWYGVSEEWYNETLAKQFGGCAICGSIKNGKKRCLGVDHNHTTKQVRGLLCHLCNSAIERFETVPDWADKAKKYLEKYAHSPANTQRPPQSRPASDR